MIFKTLLPILSLLLPVAFSAHADSTQDYPHDDVDKYNDVPLSPYDVLFEMLKPDKCNKQQFLNMVSGNQGQQPSPLILCFGNMTLILEKKFQVNPGSPVTPSPKEMCKVQSEAVQMVKGCLDHLEPCFNRDRISKVKEVLDMVLKLFNHLDENFFKGHKCFSIGFVMGDHWLNFITLKDSCSPQDLQDLMIPSGNSPDYDIDIRRGGNVMECMQQTAEDHFGLNIDSIQRNSKTQKMLFNRTLQEACSPKKNVESKIVEKCLPLLLKCFTEEKVAALKTGIMQLQDINKQMAKVISNNDNLCNSGNVFPLNKITFSMMIVVQTMFLKYLLEN